jgi:PIN domain nuclease of toxin-antitoxin system
MILNEPGGERVEVLLDELELGLDADVFISSVNWCEILTRMQREKLVMSGERLSSVLTGVELAPFVRSDAEMAATFSYVSRALSLGDRACLALAKSKQATAWTTERLWSQCNLDVSIELIRG